MTRVVRVKRKIDPNPWQQAVYIPPLCWTKSGLRRLPELPLLLTPAMRKRTGWRRWLKNLFRTKKAKHQ